VRRALLLILALATFLIFAAAAPATAQTLSRRSACGLLSSAQASTLLSAPVVQQHPGGVSPTECWFVVYPLPSPAGVPRQINLHLSPGSSLPDEFKVAAHPKTNGSPAKANLLGEGTTGRRHFVKVAGDPSYWIRSGVSEVSSGVVTAGTTFVPPTIPANAHGVTFTSSKDGFVIQVTVQGVSDPEQVARQAMGDALMSL
jgi:hypothetical protein